MVLIKPFLHSEQIFNVIRKFQRLIIVRLNPLQKQEKNNDLCVRSSKVIKTSINVSREKKRADKKI